MSNVSRRPSEHQPARTVTHPAVSSAPAQPHGAGGQGKLLVLALTALGVVYGDLGTSPLYALRETFHGHYAIPTSSTNVLGVLSLTFWSLILVVTIKYIVFILRADNRGEGGILALMALATPIRRFAPGARPRLILLGVLGAAFLYGDGIITPAISVLSAVEGLTVATPVFEPYILPLACVILIGLFLIQRSGTARIGQFFGPIMLLWFAVLALLGLNSAAQNPGVIRAVNPLYAVEFFRANGWTAFLALGAVFLVLTGGEALYADLGHFGRRPIRVGWFSVVLPALLLNYAGQGALLLREPAAAANPFFFMAPAWARLPLVVLATAATVIASQALISGVFSITLQAEQLGFLPRRKIVHTSPDAFGQIYIPFVNWALMAACLLVVIGFRSSTNLAAAFGIAVTSTMAITTVLFAVVARRRWRWSRLHIGLLAGFFMIIDLAFLTANLVKIPQGGWFPLVVAAVLFLIMTTWKRGNQLVFQREQHLEMSLRRLRERLAAQPPLRIARTAIFFSANPGGAPAAMLANLQYNGVVHERVLLLTVLSESVPHIEEDERLHLETLGTGLYRCSLHFGFMEEPDVPLALRALPAHGFAFEPDEVPYFVSRTLVIPTALPGMALWRERLYRILRHNSASPVDFFRLAPGQVFEITTAVEV